MQIPGNAPSAGKKPTTPIIGTAVAGSLSASVPFTPSAYIGKATITYTATSNPGGVQATSASSPITVSSLIGGTQYTFTVVGTTNYGVPSDASDFSNPVTPTGAPPFFPPFFPFFPFFPTFPPTCTPSCGPYTVSSVVDGPLSNPAWSACVNNQQTRNNTYVRTTYSTATCTASDCSTYTSTTSSTATITVPETQACGTPPQTTYYACCTNGLLVSGQYASSNAAAENFAAQCAADEPGNALVGGVFTTPQNCV